MTTTRQTGPRSLEPVALRAFKAVMIATGSVGVLSALGLAATHAAKVDVAPGGGLGRRHHRDEPGLQ